MTIKMLIFDYKDTEHKFFAENIFQSYDIKFFRHSLNPKTFDELSDEEKEQTSVISIFSDSVLTEDIIRGFKNLRTIATRSSNYDNINKRVCHERHIAVLNVPSYGKTAVAEFTFGLIINLIRKIPQAIESVKNHSFPNRLFHTFTKAHGLKPNFRRAKVFSEGSIRRIICFVPYHELKL